jgi:hypothetical protein
MRGGAAPASSSQLPGSLLFCPPLRSAPLRTARLFSTRGSPPCARRQRPRLPRALWSAGRGATAAARAAKNRERWHRGGAESFRPLGKERVRGDSRGAAGWRVGRGDPGGPPLR